MHTFHSSQKRWDPPNTCTKNPQILKLRGKKKRVYSYALILAFVQHIPFKIVGSLNENFPLKAGMSWMQMVPCQIYWLRNFFVVGFFEMRRGVGFLKHFAWNAGVRKAVLESDFLMTCWRWNILHPLKQLFNNVEAVLNGGWEVTVRHTFRKYNCSMDFMHGCLWTLCMPLVSMLFFFSFLFFLTVSPWTHLMFENLNWTMNYKSFYS